MYGSSIHVLDRPPDGHRETSVCGSPSYEAHSVASEKKLACPGSPRKSDSGPSVTPPSFGLVVGPSQCTERSTPAPSSACRSTVYRRLKRRLGRTLRRLHCKRRLVFFGKSPSHKFSRTKGSPSGPATVRTSLQESDCACCSGQHNSGLIHKQARGYEVRLSLCPPVETSVLVPSQGHNPTGQTHSRSLECDSRQTFQAQSSNPDRVVPLPTGVQSVVLQVCPTTGGFVCDPVQSKATKLCVTGAGSGSLGSGRPEFILGASEGARLPSSRPASPGNLKVTGSGLSQNDSGCPRLAKHALVLGPGGPISSDSLQSTSDRGPVDSTLQRAATQEPQESQSPCLAPRSSAIRKHGFSEEVAAQIEAPQRGSTRAVYKSKWAIFIKWCESNKVDFRSPSVNQIAEFLLYLFKERKLQPSTIDGYRTAIADMVGNDTLNISSDKNLTRLLPLLEPFSGTPPAY